MSPIWSINGTRLIRRDTIQSFNAHVPRHYLNGSRQATLILYSVSLTFNGSILSCSTNLSQILGYTILVGEYTMSVAPNINFYDYVHMPPIG